MTKPARRPVSIPQAEVYSFASQAWQYAQFGVPGVSYYRGWLDVRTYVNCLLFRDEHGLLIGVLNHYPIGRPLEKAGNVNIFIHPAHKRQGIGTALVTECIKRWGPINFDQQRYTPEGSAFVQSLEKSDYKNP